jgi:hypothetical protein
MAINTNSDTLIALGLNGSQARIYLALVDNGICLELAQTYFDTAWCAAVKARVIN